MSSLRRGTVLYIEVSTDLWTGQIRLHKAIEWKCKAKQELTSATNKRYGDDKEVHHQTKQCCAINGSAGTVPLQEWVTVDVIQLGCIQYTVFYIQYHVDKNP